jgi:hypothetical protein
VSAEFFFRNSATGTRITAKHTVDYIAIQKFLYENITNSLHFTQRRINLLKPFRHLSGNISEEDITVVLQEVDYDVISVQQITAKRHTHLPPPLPIYGSEKTKSSRIFKLTTLCSIVIKAEAYRSKTGFYRMLLFPAPWSYLGAV